MPDCKSIRLHKDPIVITVMHANKQQEYRATSQSSKRERTQLFKQLLGKRERQPSALQTISQSTTGSQSTTQQKGGEGGVEATICYARQPPDQPGRRTWQFAAEEGHVDIKVCMESAASHFFKATAG